MQTLALFFLTYNSLSLFLVLTLSLFTFLSITTISLSHYYTHSLSLQYNTLFLFNYYNLSLAILYSVTQTHTSDRPGICFAKNESISSSSSYSKVYFESSLKQSQASKEARKLKTEARWINTFFESSNLIQLMKFCLVLPLHHRCAYLDWVLRRYLNISKLIFLVSR